MFLKKKKKKLRRQKNKDPCANDITPIDRAK